jgi:hypothetical protein
MPEASNKSKLRLQALAKKGSLLANSMCNGVALWAIEEALARDG